MYNLLTRIQEGLVDHAKYEMDLVGLFDQDADYEGMIANSVMELMQTFAGQGHSGGSSEITRDLFHRLSNFETLSSITDDPDEWQDTIEMGTDKSKTLWQNKRDPKFFSKDGGKTYYDVETPEKIMTSEPIKKDLE
jgi:hypothetical protein